MSKLVGLPCVLMILFVAMKPQSEKFSKYKAIEAYEIRPGILMMPRYSDDGQVCEIGLERRHYSPDMIGLESGLSREEIDQVFEELVPTNERGPRSKDFRRDLIVMGGHAITTIVDFQNVTIQIHGSEVSASSKREIVEDGIAATLQWKNRKCR